MQNSSCQYLARRGNDSVRSAAVYLLLGDADRNVLQCLVSHVHSAGQYSRLLPVRMAIGAWLRCETLRRRLFALQSSRLAVHGVCVTHQLNLRSFQQSTQQTVSSVRRVMLKLLVR